MEMKRKRKPHWFRAEAPLHGRMAKEGLERQNQVKERASESEKKRKPLTETGPSRMR